MKKRTYCKKKTRKYKLASRYGISVEQYEDMLKEQDNSCKICGKHEDEELHSLAVDHCHDTGKVRSLLCMSCNTGLGLFKDNKELLIKAQDYLEKHKEEN